MAPPLLPAAERARDEIEEAVEAFVGQGGSAPLFLLTGEAGGGKSTLLHKLAENASRRGLVPVLLLPPESGLDAPAHALIQAGATLRKAGVNGVLAPLFSVEAAFGQKVEALVKAAKQERLLLLARVPEPWIRRQPEAPEEVGVAARAGLLLNELLDKVAVDCPTVVVQRDTTAWPDAARQRARHLHVERSSGHHFLRDPGRWGSLLPHATLLVERLGPSATRVAPLTLRLGVALLALGQPADEVGQVVRTGLQTTVNLLGEELAHHPRVLMALWRMSFARFPLPLSDMRELAGTPPLPEEERHLVEHTLLLEVSDGGWVLHPRVRQAVGEWARELTGALDERQVHADLARIHGRRHQDPPLWDQGYSGAVAWMEDLFHSAGAGDRDRVLAHACDISQWLTLGRTLSLRHAYQSAAEVYRAALDREPENSYAAQYLAFNLERQGGAGLEAERWYRKALDSEPGNPWWNRRYIRCLLARGKPAAAFDAFVEAQEKFEDSPRAPDEGWLARHFHTGVVKGFLEAGELDRAAKVLGTLSRSTLEDELALRGLRNRLKHRQEAEELGGAVFPEHLDFDTRWSLGPHTLRSEAARKQVAAWFPGRIVRTGPEVVLEFSAPPAEGTTPELLRKEVPAEELKKLARLAPDEPVEAGQFIEVLCFQGGSERIGLHHRGPTLRMKPSAASSDSDDAEAVDG